MPCSAVVSVRVLDHNNIDKLKCSPSTLVKIKTVMMVGRMCRNVIRWRTSVHKCAGVVKGPKVWARQRQERVQVAQIAFESWPCENRTHDQVTEGVSDEAVKKTKFNNKNKHRIPFNNHPTFTVMDPYDQKASHTKQTMTNDMIFRIFQYYSGHGGSFIKSGKSTIHRTVTKQDKLTFIVSYFGI